MIQNIERRNNSIEEIRKAYLKYYFDNSIEGIDSNAMQALGLNMYTNNESIKNKLYTAFSRSNFNSEVIMHPQQIECLNYLMKGDNLLISAPTSFGKTFIALEYISRRNFNNIAFVVPTLALMNELFLKIKNMFGEKYCIIQNGFEEIADKNIFIIVPERADRELLHNVNELDFLVFDEIYKLQRPKQDSTDTRIISLNRGYFELVNRAKQVLLLGPFISDISFERTQLTQNITKYITDYSPVYVNIDFVEDNKDRFVLQNIYNDTSKLIYFGSPKSIYDFSVNNIFYIDIPNTDNSLTQWCDKYISNKWLPSEMLKKGIGIHHGRLPGFMRRYVENLYNSNQIKTMLCTSTLLEGINTPTNELIVYDSSELSAFRINNLIGRVGRLNYLKKGQVYLFDRSLNEYLVGDEKYEKIKIVAENEDVLEIEEVIYLEKSENELSSENYKLYNELKDWLSKYNKTVTDLTTTDGFVIPEFLLFFEKLNDILELTKKLEAADRVEETYIRGNIIECFMSIITHKRRYVINDINSNLTRGKRIKSAVCVNKLLNYKPNSIYERIKKEIDNHVKDLSEGQLNLFIDYLFDLAFSYIKYDLSRIVAYFDFVFDEEYLSSNKDIDILYKTLNKEVLRRLRVFNCDNDRLLKLLIDLDIPYKDAKQLSKMITKKFDMSTVSTSKVIDALNDLFDDIIQNKEIEEVTKDLLKVLLQR